MRFFNSVILQTAFDDKFNDMGQLQLLLCDFLDPKQTPEQKKLISVFRGSYKTAQILGYALYEFCWAVQEERSTSIVYNTATKENAEGMNDDFRHTLRTCQLLRWIFDKLPEDPDNAFSKFTKIKVEYKNVKFHVASLDTRQVSRHYKIVINDDLVNDDNAYSDIERENVKRKWKFQKSILTRYKKFGVGMEIDVGTVYHAHDLMADLVSKKNKYRKFIIPYALPLPGEDRVDLKTHRGRLTFPEMFCWEDFEDIYDDQGASIFATQYELKVLPESDRLVNEEDIRFWKFLPDNRQRLLIVDPAGTEKGKNDPSGFVVMDIDETGKVYIVYAKHFWLKSHAVIEMMQALQRAYRIESEDVYVEREKYSIAMADTIEHFYPTANFSFVDHKNEPTEKRIFRLKQWFDTNRILLGDDQRDLIYETTNYPDIKHEDLLVCVAYGIKVMSPPKKKTAQPFEEAVEPGFAADIAKLQKLQAARQVNYDRYF